MLSFFSYAVLDDAILYNVHPIFNISKLQDTQLPVMLFNVSASGKYGIYRAQKLFYSSLWQFRNSVELIQALERS